MNDIGGHSFRAIQCNACNKTTNMLFSFLPLLQPPQIADEKLRATAMETLGRRQIFSHRMFELLDIYERCGGLTDVKSEEFVWEARDSFQWYASAAVPHDDYLRLLRGNSVLADIVAFRSLYINHLTPRTSDIDAIQSGMANWNIPLEEYVEGPPRKELPNSSATNQLQNHRGAD